MNLISPDFLKQMNECLQGIDASLSLPDNPRHSIFIVGAPRSGTTLLYQMMTSCLDVGYIDNLAAAFWSAPAMGSLLSRKLISERPFIGTSEYGRTQHIFEPHEFGKFWNDRLGYVNMIQKNEADSVDWNSLVETLDQISSAQGRAVVYKVFILYWHLAEFHRLRPDSRWILITRDLISNAESLLRVRMNFTGDIREWSSAVPQKALEVCGQASPFHQVLAQVIYINEWIEREFSRIAPESWCKIRLDDLLADPAATMGRLASFAGVDAFPESIRDVALRVPNTSSPEAGPWRKELVAAARDMGLQDHV